MTKKKHQTYVVLKGEGVHCHVLEGEFRVDAAPPDQLDFKSTKFFVDKDGVLNHVTPNGGFAEHYTLPITKGLYVQGRQLEMDPFSNKYIEVWD